MISLFITSCASYNSRTPQQVGGEVENFAKMSAQVNKAKPCGLTGSVTERIKDCSQENDAEKGAFVLVTRTRQLKTVYLDKVLGILWSNKLPERMSHFDAEKTCRSVLNDELGGITEVLWELPDAYDFTSAYANGMRKAFSDTQFEFWTTSKNRTSYSDEKWIVYGDYPTDEYSLRYDEKPGQFHFRCKARYR